MSLSNLYNNFIYIHVHISKSDEFDKKFFTKTNRRCAKANENIPMTHESNNQKPRAQPSEGPTIYTIFLIQIQILGLPIYRDSIPNNPLNANLCTK